MYREEIKKRLMELNHSWLKNSFSGLVGNMRSDVSIDTRSRKINIVWAVMRGEVIDSEDISTDATLKVVRLGFRYWPTIKQMLEDFFNYAPYNCKFKRAASLEEVAVKLFSYDGKNVIISKFIEDFESLAFQSEEVCKQRLILFWEAVDYVQDKLTEMTNSANDPDDHKYFEEV